MASEDGAGAAAAAAVVDDISLTFPDFVKAAKERAKQQSQDNISFRFEDVIRFDCGSCPKGVEMWGDAEIKVLRIKTPFVAETDAVGSFSTAIMRRGKRMESPEHLRTAVRRMRFRSWGADDVYEKPSHAPVRDLTWDNVMDCLADDLSMEDLGLTSLEKQFPKGPPLAMPFIDDGNTRLVVAFAGDVYWFEMNTS